jgi:small-conductance mechanosensitive channel
MSARRFGFLLALAIGICALSSARAGATAAAFPTVLAQLTLPTAAPAPAVSGLVVSGAYVTAPIVLDGTTLFRISAPVNPSVTQAPIAARVSDVETALGQLVAENSSGSQTATVFDPATLRVHVKRAGDAVVLQAVDAKHTDPLPIVTVTANDTNANRTSADALAAQWQSALQSALVRALELRQPAVQQRNGQRVLRVAIGLIAATLLVVGVLRVLWHRMERLEREVAQGAKAAAAQTPTAPEQTDAPQARRRFLAVSLRNLEPGQRLSLYGAVAETLMWALLLAWLFGVTWSLSRFAQTTPLAQTIMRGTFGIATTVVVTLLLNRVVDIVIHRAAGAWRLRRLGNSEDRARFLLRIPTISNALKGAKAFVLVFIAVLSVFGQIGVPIGSVVTIGGLAAVALSLAAQNFVRDFLNGFLVLYEDQYVVGDYVTINTYSGNVELLTLRMVQIRDAAGDLITIPHSSVVNVVNQSRNWSRVDYRVPVDPAADVPKAIDIVRAQIEALVKEGDWMHGVSAPIEWIGIDGLSKDAVIVRASIKTAPLRQFELRRQINERVHAAFARNGIALGAPLPVA